MAEPSKEDLFKSIKVIIKDGDLDQLSAKKIRKMLEAEYKADFTERKAEIDELVMQLITGNHSDEEIKEDVEADVNKKITNGTLKVSQLKGPSSCKKAVSKNLEKQHTSEAEKEDSDLDEIEDVVPKKKSKAETAQYNSKKSLQKLNDEQLAKQLQEREGHRPSRRCKAQPVVRKQKKPRKESTKGTSVYSRPCVLLPPLNTLLDTDRMPRPVIVKKLWEIVKERDLLDPKNKQFMLCDEQLLQVFGKKRVRMFGVMKLLKPYIKDLPNE